MGSSRLQYQRNKDYLIKMDKPHRGIQEEKYEDQEVKELIQENHHFRK